MLDEADDVGGAKVGQIDRTVTEAMIEESVGEPQRVIDRSRAQAPLLDEIIFEVGEQHRSRDVRRSVDGSGCTTPMGIR